jgi:hypothetical protein
LKKELEGNPPTVVNEVINNESDSIKAFKQLRKQVLQKMANDLTKRLRQNSQPTDIELRLGCYCEQLEPQVREAIIGMNELGYETTMSGFRGLSGANVQEIQGFFRIDEEVVSKLKLIGVQVSEGETYSKNKITIIEFHSENPDLDEIKSKWSEIIDLLPWIAPPAVFRSEEQRLVNFGSSREIGVR